MVFPFPGRPDLRWAALVFLTACSGDDSGPAHTAEPGEADGGSGGDGSDSGRPTLVRPRDDVLRLNELQALATHNSYHLQSDQNMIPGWQFSRDPLDVQFGEQGVRSVEIDTQRDATTGEVRVLHVPTIDQESTCPTLRECLAVVRTWSDANPAHHALFIHLEPKDFDYGATFEFGGYVDQVEDLLLEAFPLERIITPDEVQGDAETLRDAVTTDGWPTLGETRGRVLFYVNETEAFYRALTRGETSVADRLMFPQAPDTSPLAAVLIENDPFSDIPSLVDAGFIVRTRADDENSTDATESRAAALESGAQLVTTDYPVPRGVMTAFSIPEGTPSRCNPRTASAECESTDIEEL